MRFWWRWCAVRVGQCTRDLSVCRKPPRPQFSSPHSSAAAIARQVTGEPCPWLLGFKMGCFNSSGWLCCKEAWFSTLITALIQAWPSGHSSWSVRSDSHLVPCPVSPTTSPWCGQNSELRQLVNAESLSPWMRRVSVWGIQLPEGASWKPKEIFHRFMGFQRRNLHINKKLFRLIPLMCLEWV